MRLMIRLAAVLAVLVVIALVGLAVALPRLAASDTARARIQQVAQEATGRAVRYDELDVGLFPPRLVVTQAEVGGAAEGDEPMLAGADVELRLALAPLLAMAVVVDSLVIEGATVRLVRTQGGIELPIAAEPSDPSEPARGSPSPETPAATPEEGEDAGSELKLAIRSVGLRDSRVIFEDRAVTPAVTWDLRDIDGAGEGRSFDDPIDFAGSFELASGGKVEVGGHVSLSGGAFELNLALDGVELAPAAPYLAEGQRAAGSLHGTVGARGTLEAPDTIALKVTLEDGDVAIDENAFEGRLQLVADVSGGLETPDGRFEIDATEAALRYGETFRKPPGTPATVKGRIVTGADGSLGVDDTHLLIRNFSAQVSAGQKGERIEAQLDAVPFDLAGWEELLPALADSLPKGRIGLEKLRITTAPLEVRGSVQLDDVTVRLPEKGDLVLRGVLEGQGDRIRGTGVSVIAAAQEMSLDLEVSDLEGALRFSVDGQTKGADSGALLSAFAEKGGTLSGPLDVDLDIAGAVGTDTPLVEAVQGSLSFAVHPGQLKGVSLLEQAFDRLGGLGDAVLLAGRIKGGSSLQRFYGDEFDSLSGTLRLKDGKARTSDLRLVYRHYTVALKGTVDLVKETLDLSGSLSIGQEIDDMLAGREGTPPASQEDSASGRGVRVLPLASVTGSFDAPRVSVGSRELSAFARSYALDDRRRKKWSDKIDKKLGTGSGDRVLDVLDGILGGRNK